jgi:nucleolar protein 56
LENCNSVSEGLATEELKEFLRLNLPKKLKKVALGVLDPKLGAILADEVSFFYPFMNDIMQKSLN